MRRTTRATMAGGLGLALLGALVPPLAVAQEGPGPGDADLATPAVRTGDEGERIFFVMPDRFDNGDPSNDAGGLTGDREATGLDPTDAAFFHGGDLAGLLDRMDYVEGLGATALWITPPFANKPVQGDPDVFQSAGYHGYWAVDYTTVDPHFGTNAELVALVDDAHARGMEVYLDVVVNHTADVIVQDAEDTSYVSKSDQPYTDVDGTAFDDRDFVGGDDFPELDPATSFPYPPVLPADALDRTPDFLDDLTNYHNRGSSTFSGENSQYGDFFGLDDLFTEKPEVVAGFEDLAAVWLDDWGVDGFRLDTAKHVNVGFWEQWAASTEEAGGGDADVYLFGEVFGETPAFRSIFSRRSEMDATLDFSFQGAVTGYLNGSSDAGSLQQLFADDDWYTDADSNAQQLATFLGNHDLGRVAQFVRDTNPGATDDELVERLTLGHAVMYLARGVPVVYAGDEQGFAAAEIEGYGEDINARLTQFATQTEGYAEVDLVGTDATAADDNFDTSHPLYVALGDLAGLLDANPALQSGAQLHRLADGGVYAFSRIDRDEQVEHVVAVNNTDATATASIPTDSPGIAFATLWSTGADASPTADGDGVITVDVPARGALVLQADAPLPARDAAPAVTLGVPEPIVDAPPNLGLTQVGNWLTAELDAPAFTEVTFAASTDGGATDEVVGTDDNAPYRVLHATHDLEPGTEITYRAVVDALRGNLAGAGTVGTAPDPGTGGGGGGDCEPTTAVVHFDPGEGVADDWRTWAFFDITNEMPGPYPEGLEWDGEDDFGAFRTLDLTDGAQQVGFIVVDETGAKNGTEDDRIFDPRESPEVWVVDGDPVTYTSEAAARGTVTVHYRRPDGDYGDPTSDDFNDFWGLHLWGDALADGVATDWPQPRKPDGVDDFGAYWEVPIDDADAAFNWIVHRGDAKDPGPDQTLTPSDDFADVWIRSGDEELYRTRASATDTAVLHYRRADGDYGTWPSDDFNDFWGLHVWTGAAEPTDWPDPIPPTGTDRWGVYYEVPLVDGASELAYIIHRGDAKDLPDDQLLDLDGVGHEVWIRSGEEGYVLPTACDGGGGAGEGGSLATASAHWLTADTIAWGLDLGPDALYALHTAPDGGLELVEGGVAGGEAVPLEWVADTLPADLAETWPHLADHDVLRVPDDVDVPAALRGQVAVSATVDGVRVDATSLQVPGVLDDLWATDAPLGVTLDDDGVPSFGVWAPTAMSVTLRTYATGDADVGDITVSAPMTRDDDTGVWSYTPTTPGALDNVGVGSYYLYEVEVYVPSTGAVETNLVTDPYSVSLATNSAKSQVVDLDDPALAPDDWRDLGTVAPDTFEAANLYELHVRDFSITDETVPDELRGTYGAFALEDSDGAEHLAALADAGVTNVHLLPTFDIATIEEVRAAQLEPDPSPEDSLDDYPPDSEVPQARVAAVADQDGFNWGYDPWHYTAVEGSYAVDPMGAARVREYREMSAGLKRKGLGLVQDVVYNHTAQAGQADKSVLDRIVPGYYHRLLEDGAIATSTCCQNTAPEHAMMGRLVVDSIVTLATTYKVDGFRFDLMGHHPKANILAVREALDALTVADDGVDGERVLLYGEGWNFGEVADDARFEQATQANMAGTGIATFNDRLRDAVRGGGPFDEDPRIQGFGSGAWSDPNGADVNGTEDDQLARLLLNADQVRVGLAGNLADYTFTDRTGTEVTGAEVDYNGAPAGYNADPQENLLYVSAHDNETLFDSNVFKLPTDASQDTRSRMQVLGLATVVYGQGMTFLHAGSELLRSKSLDRDSFNSGDHFNEVDWAYQHNNFGVGLPDASKNAEKWDLMRPLLADPGIPATPEAIAATFGATADLHRVQASSPLFALTSAEQVQDKVAFLNTGPDQAPGVIVMHLDDTVGEAVDAARERLVVVFNATPDEVAFDVEALVDRDVALHPALADGSDPVTASASFDAATGTFTVPGRTVAVFEEASGVVEPLEVELRAGAFRYGSAGFRWVAIESSEALDAPAEVDRATVRFGPTGTETAPRTCFAYPVGRGARLDLLCILPPDAYPLLPARPLEGVLTAETTDGRPIRGELP